MAITANTILDIVRGEIGTQATNYKKCKYNTDFYGYVVSASWADWCAVFVWWVFHKAGADKLLYVKTAGCGELGAAFNNRGRFYKSGFKAGDVVFFHWSSDKSTSVPGAYSLDHVGIIEKVNADGSYTTIEGNTGGGNGAVMRRTRYASQISGVGRPDYDGQVTPTGPDVGTVQKWLNDTYKAGLDVDKIYGGKTELALVKALQTELNKQFGAGLEVDGVYGPKTAAAIVDLSRGDEGNLTKILQGALLCNGYGSGGFDGIFGSGTEAAVREYQYKNALSADGIAGRQTFGKLFG